ncbi:MAG: chromosome segregation protein SMC, partial [Gammaproteobacteria bacterium]
DNASKGLDSVTHQIRQLREQEKRVGERLDAVRAQLQNDRGRLASLEALQEAALGKVSKQVDEWLARHSLQNNSRLAESLQVTNGWERAVEVALGTALQSVQVSNIADIATDVSDLGEGSIGLLESPPQESDLESGDAADLLLSHVRAPRAAHRLLRGVFAADTLEAALEMRARLKAGESIITRSGVWVGDCWLRVAGRDDPHAGVIARGEEMERLRQSIQQTSHRGDDLAKALADTRFQIEQLEGKRVSTQEELNRRQQLFTAVTARLTSCRGEAEQTQTRLRQLDQSIAERSQELSQLNTRIEASRQSSESGSATVLRRKVTEDELAAEHSGLQAQLEAHRAAAEECRAGAQELIINIESRRRSKDSASAALKRVRDQQLHLQGRKAELEAAIASSEQPFAQDEAALEEQLESHAQVEARLAESRQRVEAAETQVRDLEMQRGDKQNAVDAARAAADELRMELRELEVRAETIKEQFDNTGLVLDEVVAALEEGASIDSWAEKLEGIGRRIQRLGAINLAAIGEFQEQSERKEYLDKQFNDLSEALETLEAAIRKIDRETRSKFKETFDKANQGLSELFPRLFGGGHAYLELDSDDLLASGVSIMARPPGKRISTIHLMSGGEKALTAVALVFSIFGLNPAPFCLLDEVDAPLDEANVGRFCDIVREMSKQVQFVLITHNKTTMESMDQLSGVTMSEPGVSRLVAVDIDEAVQLAAM